MLHRLLVVCILFVLQPIFFPEMGNFAKFSSKHEGGGFSLCTLYSTALHCLCLVDIPNFRKDCSLYSTALHCLSLVDIPNFRKDCSLWFVWLFGWKKNGGGKKNANAGKPCKSFARRKRQGSKEGCCREETCKGKQGEENHPRVWYPWIYLVHCFRRRRERTSETAWILESTSIGIPTTRRVLEFFGRRGAAYKVLVVPYLCFLSPCFYPPIPFLFFFARMEEMLLFFRVSSSRTFFLLSNIFENSSFSPPCIFYLEFQLSSFFAFQMCCKAKRHPSHFLHPLEGIALFVALGWEYECFATNILSRYRALCKLFHQTRRRRV